MLITIKNVVKIFKKFQKGGAHPVRRRWIRRIVNVKARISQFPTILSSYVSALSFIAQMT